MNQNTKSYSAIQFHITRQHAVLLKHVLKSRNGLNVTQFSLTDVCPVGSIYDELGVFTNFLSWRKDKVLFLSMLQNISVY